MKYWYYHLYSFHNNRLYRICTSMRTNKFLRCNNDYKYIFSCSISWYSFSPKKFFFDNFWTAKNLAEGGGGNCALPRPATTTLREHAKFKRVHLDDFGASLSTAYLDG